MIDRRTESLEKALAENGFLIVPVRGVSMLPMLDEAKDAVKIVPLNGRMERYDLPLYFRPKDGGLVLHRVTGVKKGGYLTCGDNQKSFEFVKEQNVIGVAAGYYRDGTYIPCTDPAYRQYVEQRCRDIAGRELFPKKLSAEWKTLAGMTINAAGFTGAGESDPAGTDGDALDWKTLFSLAKAQEIAAFLYRKSDLSDCPPEVRTEWESFALNCRERDLQYRTAVEEMAAALADGEVRFLRIEPAEDFVPDVREYGFLYDAKQKKLVTEILNRLGFRVDEGEDGGFPAVRGRTVFRFCSRLTAGGVGYRDAASRVTENGDAVCAGGALLDAVGQAYEKDRAGRLTLGTLLSLRALTDAVKDETESGRVTRVLRKSGYDGILTAAVSLTDRLSGCTDGLADLAPLCRMAAGKPTLGTRKGFGALMRRIFPSFAAMKRQYPSLKKAPVLLPACWLARLFGRLKRKITKIG